MPYPPTIAGRQLARELRQLREGKEWTGEWAATQLSWEQSKISRMETAKMRITAGEVMELCELYGVDGERRTRLVALARKARERDWWHEYSDVAKRGFIDFLAFEAEAQTSRGYEAQVIPGILQTSDYARAILAGSNLKRSEEVGRGVEVRLARQARIDDPTDPLNVWAVIDESVLHRVVDSPAVMRGQFQHLLDVGERTTVSIQVLPYQTRDHPAVDGPFVLFTFDGYPDLLYIEHLMGCIYRESPEDTDRGSRIFEDLRSVALNTGASAALIREQMKKMT